MFAARVCWGARVTFGYECVRARISTADHMQAGTPRVPRMHTWQACRPLISEPEVMFVETVLMCARFLTRTTTLVAQEDAGKKANTEIHLKTTEIQNLQGELAALKVFVCVYTSTLIYTTHEHEYAQGLG